MKKAIILDAGEGKRLRPLTQGKPKCLLKVDRVSILEHQLANLVKCGIGDVVFVLGYHSDTIVKKLEKERFDLSFRYIYNSIYQSTNTVYSLWLARNELNEDLIYLNGDVLFHRDVLKRLMDCKRETCLAVDKKTVREEEVKVRIENNVIKQIGKGIDPTKAHGEFIGLGKFSEEFNELLKKRLNEVVAEGRINAFFEVAVDRTLAECDVFAVDISDLPCVEIDTYQDLKKARKIYLNMIKKGFER